MIDVYNQSVAYLDGKAKTWAYRCITVSDEYRLKKAAELDAAEFIVYAVDPADAEYLGQQSRGEPVYCLGPV